MIIKKGFDGKDTHIRIYGRSDERIAEFWIEQEGLKDIGEEHQRYETLAYISLEELLDLKEEIEEAIKRITGVGRGEID